MPHLTIDDLANGLLDKMPSKDNDRIKKQLTQVGQQVALDTACSVVEGRTGLPSDVCTVVGKAIIKKVKKKIRERMS